MSAATSGSATAVEAASSSTRPRGRTSKSELITALAAELKREKERGVGLSTEVEQAEAGLDEKHDQLLRLEEEYETQSRRNEQIIANLRRDLEKANEKLEQASHCDDVEAGQYLALLDGQDTQSRTHRSRSRTQPTQAHSSFSRETEAAFESPLPPPVLQPRSPDRPRPSPKSHPTAPISASAADRTEQRLQRLNERLADENRGAPPSSRTPNRPTPSSGPHGGSRTGSRTRLEHPVTQAIRVAVAPPVEKSQWGESPDSSPGAAAGGLARNGSVWKKVFPGAYGRK